MEIDAVLLVLRALAHLITFAIVASFHDPEARWRPGVSLLAVLLAGSSAALAAQILTNWAQVIQSGPQLFHTLFAYAVLALIAWTRGNLAKLLPRMKWQ